MADWQDLEGSSAISATRYDAALRELSIRFRGGKETTLLGVPSDVHQALRDSPSAGGFYHRQLRGRFRSASEGRDGDNA